MGPQSASQTKTILEVAMTARTHTFMAIHLVPKSASGVLRTTSHTFYGLQQTRLGTQITAHASYAVQRS